MDPSPHPLDPDAVEVPGIDLHHVPALHPDDIAEVRGIRVTNPSRTLIDLAEMSAKDDLRDAFRRALERGLLDEAIDEFCG